MARKATAEQKAKAKVRRSELCKRSAEASKARTILGLAVPVNVLIVEQYKKETGCSEFKTFHQWRESGYKVKKGAESFAVWGSPVRKDQKKQAEADAAGAATVTGGNDKREYWPICYLFNESQVEPI